MEGLHNEQVIEQITIYENKIKIIKERIRGELRTRRDLKTKLDEAMKRETIHILSLERLDEYEKIVSIKLESAKKMEDSESIKHIAIIDKYEIMLQEQQKVWLKFQKEYEQLPLAKEKQKAELRLLKMTIQNKIVYFKINEIHRNIRIKWNIDKRIEQIKIIELAKLYIEHKIREKRCCESMEKLNKLKINEQELRLEVNYLEMQPKEIENLHLIVKQTSIKPQQLPQVDLSRFIIHRNTNYDNIDTFSVNSYMLEQEYMNNDEQLKQMVNSPDQPQCNNTQLNETEQNSHESNLDINLMELDKSKKQIVLNESCTANKLNSLKNIENYDSGVKSISNEIPFNIEKLHIQSHKSDQLNQPSKIHNFERVHECDRKINGIALIKKTSNQEIKQNFDHSNGRNTPDRRESLKVSTLSNRPIPSPAKIAKRLSEEKLEHQQQKQELEHQKCHRQQQQQFGQRQHQQQQQFGQRQHQQQHYEQQNHNQQQYLQYNQCEEQQQYLEYNQHKEQQQQHQHQYKQQDLSLRTNLETTDFIRDLTLLPLTNKPQIKKFEVVKYPNMQVQFKMKEKQGHIQVKTTIPMETSQTPITRGAEQPSPGDFPMEDQSMASNTPMNIPSTSIMSTTLHSVDLSVDNISAILGSEITEPGGSFELARRLYADSDLNSEGGDFNYEKMMENFCSPIQTKPKVQQRSLPFVSEQQKNSNNDTSQVILQKQNDRNFVFGQFKKKHTNTTQRFF